MRMSSDELSQILARNKHVTVGESQPAPPMTIAPTTDVAKLNKTEREFYGYLRSDTLHQWVGVQCLTFKLGDDTRYTPDFITISVAGDMIAHEVKGFWRDDAKVKIKVAARMFPFVRFQVAMKVKGQWSQTPIKP